MILRMQPPSVRSISRQIILCGCLALLFGCGTTPTPTAATPSAPAAAPLTGNWQFELFSNPTSVISNFNGALTQQGSAFTGTFRLQILSSGTPCVPTTQDISFTGAVDAADTLTLTSVSFASGSVATLKLQLPLSAENFANGTAQITGGLCPVASSTVLAIYVPPVTGTYTATLSSFTTNGGTSTPVGPATLVITQAAANADGQFPVSSSIVVTSSTCNLNVPLSGVITGLELSLTGGATGFGFPAYMFNAGAAPPGAGRLAGGVLLVEDPANCPTGIYNGAFVRQ